MAQRKRVWLITIRSVDRNDVSLIKIKNNIFNFLFTLLFLLVVFFNFLVVFFNFLVVFFNFLVPFSSRFPSVFGAAFFEKAALHFFTNKPQQCMQRFAIKRVICQNSVQCLLISVFVVFHS